MTPAIRIDMLGPLRVAVGDRVITRFTTQHAALLLASISLTVENAVPREMLIDRLWPEADPASGRNRLSTALSSLRRQLEPPGTAEGSVFQANRLSVGLRPGAALTDVSDFREAVRAAAVAPNPQEQISTLRHAVALYRGPFLDGLFAEWIEPVRTSLAGLCLHNIRRLVRLYAVQGHFDQALDYALQAIALDPLRQDLHRDVIHAYALLGDAAAAARHYEDFACLLKRELGQSPLASLEELYRQLQSGALSCRPGDSLPGVEETLPPSVPVTSPNSRANIPASPRLPAQLSRFIGREVEIARLHALLRDKKRRLITLSGPAGSGKTRLALEVAGHIASYSGAICFVDLTALADPELLLHAIALSLGLTSNAKAPPLEQIETALSGQRWFLVLDNFEHLVADKEQAISMVQTLLDRIPSLTCVVTSRRLLGLVSEHDFPTPPLAIPAVGMDLPEMLEMASVALFVDRAQQVLPDFQVTQRSAETVAAICRRLEGIPLALELAAARIKAIPPARMLDQLQQRFDVLVSTRRGATARHRTLWSAVEWSYILLPVEVQRFFSRLSVFRGGWTVEAAAAVSDEDNAAQYQDLLRDASLIRKEATPLGDRFRMLETLREFGWEQMDEETRAEVQRRHVNYFLRLVLNATSEDESGDQAACLLRLETDCDNTEARQEGLNDGVPAGMHARPAPGNAFRLGRDPSPDKWKLMQDMLETEHDNLRHALTFCMHDADAGETGLQLGAALQQFWWMRGHLAEGLRRLTALLSRPNTRERSSRRARALHGSASLSYLMGDVAAATAMHQEILAIKRDLGDKNGVALALNSLGLMAHIGGDYAAAGPLCAESLDIFREVENTHGIGWALSNLGNTAYRTGDFASAWAMQQESLAIRRDIGDSVGVGISLNILGDVARDQGDLSSARAFLHESLEIRMRVGDHTGAIFSLESLAVLNLADNSPDMAARLWAAMERAREETGSSIAPNDQFGYDHNVGTVRRALGEDAFARYWAEGRALTMQQAVDLVLPAADPQ